MPTPTEAHTKVVDMYDPAAAVPAWVAGPEPSDPVPAGAVPPMPSHREWGAVTLGPSGNIYVLGGAFGLTKLSSVDRYTP